MEVMTPRSEIVMVDPGPESLPGIYFARIVATVSYSNNTELITDTPGLTHRWSRASIGSKQAEQSSTPSENRRNCGKNNVDSVKCRTTGAGENLSEWPAGELLPRGAVRRDDETLQIKNDSLPIEDRYGNIEALDQKLVNITRAMKVCGEGNKGRSNTKEINNTK
ncbi:hypothetical protein L798_02257 [Zootermopsis nevadensis]|uniref:Uncharacterized protein n=1 Tax=Zootermopsis nevadensis TaxID=136037 RepID=A0A067QS72_ZOONE|nr:hypothetical protein L798_02257 [Zootermopsis nevadensis]